MCIGYINVSFFPYFFIVVFGGVGWDEDEEEIRTNRILQTSGRMRGTGSVFLLIILDYTSVFKGWKGIQPVGYVSLYLMLH